MPCFDPMKSKKIGGARFLPGFGALNPRHE
jgi:hypothetical protein